MPVDAINVKPIIRELVRTQLCFPNLQLLVDRICIIKLPSANETGQNGESRTGFSLYLTDREKSIQAAIKARLHQRITRGEIKEGSIVVLREYELARADRLNGDGKVLYLKIADFYPIGEEDRRHRPFAIVGDGVEEQPEQQIVHTTSLPGILPEDKAGISEAATYVVPTGSSDGANEDTPSEAPVTSNETIYTDSDMKELHQNKQQSSGKRPRDTAPDELDSNPRKRPQGSHSHASPILYPTIEENHPEKQTEPTPETDPSPYHDPAQSHQTAAALLKRSLSPSTPQQENPRTNLPGPLHLSTLASITHPHTTKNTLHSFLALITHVSSHTSKPPRMPRKRDLRIMDTSTSKQVLLSVFTDPVGFQPRVGTIALFEGLMTHDWDGGNLKAYPWVCEGREWCRVVDDGSGARRDLVGVNEGDVEGLRGLRGRVLWGGDEV